ncbi:MAG: molybdopterin molybdotransferase MoeA [Hyphomicrobiales bacterium]|nr:molybdopterin molybdotransferase MoeA [Hyphomicrobiales bacterium]
MAQLTDDCFAFGGPLMTIEDAARLMAARVNQADGAELCPLHACEGRILAADLLAPLPLPPFRNSAVDGYAVRFSDLNPDGESTLPVVGRVAAGDAAAFSAQGAAIRVFTGAPMPPDADTVFMQEDVVLTERQVRLPAGLRNGANMRPAGEDVAPGAVALTAGTRLGPQHLAMAAALGRTFLDVRPRLQVGVFSTGDELTEPGAALGPAAIHDSNRAMLLALVARAGADAVDLGIIRDARGELAARLKEAARQCDLVLTSGGVSTGEEDHVKPAVESIGSLVFWRIAIKPGRPVAMGVIDGAAFVGLPGNPVAVYVTFAFVVRPLLARMSGATWREPRRMPVIAAFSYSKKAGRREYVRVSLSQRADGLFEATKHPRDGAGVLSSLTETDGLLELGDHVTLLSAGDRAGFIAYGDLA